MAKLKKQRRQKRRDPIESLIPMADAVTEFPTNSMFFQWCCGCGLRHIYHFRVQRAETPDKDSIIVTLEADEVATKLRRARKRRRRNR